MDHVTGYRSVKSNNFYCYEPGKIRYTDDKTGENLEIVYDYDLVKKRFSKKQLEDNRDYSIWRYAPLLPIKSLENIPPLRIGWTPLYKSRKPGIDNRTSNLYFKDDTRNPSASFKDRASAVALVSAVEAGADIITGASTGNAGSSMACLCASMGFPAVIFVPENAPVAKLVQMLMFGAKLFAVRGNYDDAFELCLKVSQEFGWVNRNTGYNPFTREGKKTCAYEICEQMNWQVPDRVFVPVGDGNIISGIGKGFRELLEIGFIDRIPKIMGVQSSRSNSVYLSVKRKKEHPDRDLEIIPVNSTTVADSISVDLPRDGYLAARIIIESGGDAIEVTDEEILHAGKELAENEGLFCEPAASAGYAGVVKALKQGIVSPDETIVTVLTGSGLKDVKSAMKTAGEPIIIEPTISEVKRYL
jgi:threonine synthase